MDPRQSVVLATLLSFATFWIAGDDAVTRIQNSTNRLQGKPTVAPSGEGPRLTAQRAIGWAGLFLFLVILADIPATSELGASFAWLILISSLLAFGPDAFNNLSRVFGGTATNGGGNANQGRLPL